MGRVKPNPAWRFLQEQDNFNFAVQSVCHTLVVNYLHEKLLPLRLHVGGDRPRSLHFGDYQSLKLWLVENTDMHRGEVNELQRCLRRGQAADIGLNEDTLENTQ